MAFDKEAVEVLGRIILMILKVGMMDGLRYIDRRERGTHLK